MQNLGGVGVEGIPTSHHHPNDLFPNTLEGFQIGVTYSMYGFVHYFMPSN
jgi:hypothetical protein